MQHTSSPDGALNIVCFSHLRWDFVFQRPQHLLSRLAAERRVFYWEEPLLEEVDVPHVRRLEREGGVVVLQPVIHPGKPNDEVQDEVRTLLAGWLASDDAPKHYMAWYYTPMALNYTAPAKPALTVFDVMDELSAFRGAPPELLELERKLLDAADVVFVGGRSLYESKRAQHGNIHLYASSVDRAHFAQAQHASAEDAQPEDQAMIPHPRIGFYAVLDERLDTALLARIAALRPQYQFVLVGPVAKISEDDLPRANNLHYLGSKAYGALPQYLGGWDVAMMPFAINASTRFISPTKTPEFLAAGLPVVSTPVADVVHTYGRAGAVRIASTAEEFVDAVDAALSARDEAWKEIADKLLDEQSWDRTVEAIDVHMREAFVAKSASKKQVAHIQR